MTLFKPGLRTYQEAAVTYLYEHDFAMVLASVGAGKTAIALTAMRELLRDGVVSQWLVIAPLRVCNQVWPEEIKKWAPDLNIAVATGDEGRRVQALMSDADVVVINFENLPWLFKQSLVKIRMNGLVIDELTKLKNSTSARFKALYKARNQFKIRWGLTGSFTSNGLVDVFGQCKIIDDCYLGKTITGFLNNYFYGVSKGYYTDWTPKPNAVDKVMDVIYPMTFALENKSYKDNLPLLHIVPVSIDMSQSVQHVYAQMVKTSVLYADDMKTELKMTAPSAAVLVQKLQQISAGFYYDDTHVAHWISKDKIDRIEEIIEANQHAPTIIFYQYTAEYEALKARFPQIKTLMQKQESYTINDWNAGKIPILLLHPKSAGHGLNLQHGGGHIIFTSPVWSMEEYEQCIGRLHRSGQTRDVWVYVLMCKNSVDERIFNEVLPGKIAIADLAKECLTNAKENPIYPNPCSE